MSPRVRARSGVLAAGVVLALVAPGPAHAQGEDEIEDLRERREELAREAAGVAAQIDALTADDQAMVDALADIDDFIAMQESRIAAADAAIAAAEADAAAARADAERLLAEIDAIRVRLQQRAVDAFVQPTAEVVDQLAHADVGETAVRQYLLDTVIGSEFEIVDELRTAESELEEARRIALERADAADGERELQRDRLGELEISRAEAETVRAEIQTRIDTWESEAADIDAADREMEREIQRIEDEIRRAAEEARRREVERARREAEAARRQQEADALAQVDATLPAIEPGSFQLVVWPISGAVVSNFGPRVHPIFGSVRSHNGLDIDGDSGDPIVAARTGEVILAGWRNGFGNTVVVYHGDGFTTLYAHMSSIGASVGQAVDTGDYLGAVGSTGWSTGPHLHLELRIDGVAVDPRPFLP